MSNVKRVLFVCTGNSARSQMAEALLRHHAGEIFEVYSAGTQPRAIDTRALEALQRNEIDTSALRSKSIAEVSDLAFDVIITLCDKARQECATLPQAGDVLAWDFPDPHSRGGSDPFQQTLFEIQERLKMYLLLHAKAARES